MSFVDYWCILNGQSIVLFTTNGTYSLAEIYIYLLDCCTEIADYVVVTFAAIPVYKGQSLCA